MKLSAIILTKNGNDSKFKRAVESVKFADEVLVVKEKSSINDFSGVRNRALDRAKGEWVVFVDSDEIVTAELKEEILYRFRIPPSLTDRLRELFVHGSWSAIRRAGKSGMTGYKLRRQDRFLGKWLKYGETANVRLLRLAKKDAGRWVRPVHEVWKVAGNVGELKNPLLHYSHDSIEGMVEKLDRYSGMEGEWRLGKLGRLGELGILIEMVLFPVGKFIQNYIFRLGFLDGMAGFIHAGMMSGHSFLVRAKILNALMC
ncbi:MAG: glycosyltransferase family 2 protein [Patescibacteria group bacterium]|nr:glycosyltransferase family 2 protein [Patescibacteria group bacterium]